MPRCNTEAMNLHLAEIATQIAPGAHACACWLIRPAGICRAGSFFVPSNITLIPFPAKCPELYLSENIWQPLRDNWLSNRIFKSLTKIYDHCCDAWNKLISTSPGGSCRSAFGIGPIGLDRRVSGITLMVRQNGAEELARHAGHGVARAASRLRQTH